MGKLVLLVCLASSCTACWAAGYLEAREPVHIRVQAPPAPTILPVLPPIAGSPQKQSAPENAEAKPSDTPAVSAPAETGPAEFLPAEDQKPEVYVAGGEPETNFISSILGPLMSTPEQPLLTPQMLLPYFREVTAGTNRTMVMAPLTFVPPVPVQNSSSKATYIVAPAAPVK